MLALTMVVMVVEIWAGGRMLFALPGAFHAARLTALACLAAAIGGVVLPWVYLFYVW